MNLIFFSTKFYILYLMEQKIEGRAWLHTGSRGDDFSFVFFVCSKVGKNFTSGTEISVTQGQIIYCILYLGFVTLF